MAFAPLHLAEIEKILDEYIETIRPPEEIRSELDMGYDIKDQSVLLVEIRPDWRQPEIIHRSPYAKMTYVISNKTWKLYWQNGNLSWDAYPKLPTSPLLETLLKEIDADPLGCFKG